MAASPAASTAARASPSERGILNTRIIDRPMRPLFDDELRNDVVVTCTVLANDYENPVEIVASLGASIAVAYSDVPWNGPIATTNVAYVGRPVRHQPLCRAAQRLRVLRVHRLNVREGRHDRDRGQGSPGETSCIECIRIAHETNMEVVKFINTIVDNHWQAEVHV